MLFDTQKSIQININVRTIRSMYTYTTYIKNIKSVALIIFLFPKLTKKERLRVGIQKVGNSNSFN